LDSIENTMITTEQFLNDIKAQLGVPYVYGGTTLIGHPNAGLDCSGLPYAVCRYLGISIPRTSSAQYAGLEAISAADVAPGDLVFYDVPTDSPPQPAHEAVVIIPGQQIIQAPHTGLSVEYSILNIGYKIMGYRRIPELITISTPPLSTLPPPPPITSINVGEYVVSTVAINTDKNGNGWLPTSIPWATFLAATIQGSDPSPTADNSYWPGYCKVQNRSGNVLVSVIGCLPLSTINVFVATA
jgi:hypothetical protein